VSLPALMDITTTQEIVFPVATLVSHVLVMIIPAIAAPITIF